MAGICTSPYPYSVNVGILRQKGDGFICHLYRRAVPVAQKVRKTAFFVNQSTPHISDMAPSGNLLREKYEKQFLLPLAFSPNSAPKLYKYQINVQPFNQFMFHDD